MTKKSTATVTGIKTFTCVVCGASKTEVIPTIAEDISVVFNDIKKSDYFYASVLWAADNSVTTGTSLTTFSPDDKCTRAQIVTFLWRAMGSPKVIGGVAFTDIKKDGYYYDAVVWAVRNGITSGTTSTTFEPNSACTRAQIVTFLWRAGGEKRATISNPFTDTNTKAFYGKAMLWAVENGITTGTSDTKFSPDDACTRGQCVTFLYRSFN